MKVFAMLKTVTKSLFTGPATLMYPGRQRVYAPITRGQITIEIDKCIFCGMCSRKCPTYAITVTKEKRQWTIDRLNCTACGRCVEVCPVKCLHMDNHYSPAVRRRDDALFTAAASPKPDATVQQSTEHPSE